MDVELLAFTKDPLRVIYSAAKQCYSKKDAKVIFSSSGKVKPSKIKQFIEHLSARGHLSPLEHVSFTFAVSGISRTCSHQLVRHRIASYSQQSQRYVDMEDFKYIIPPSIKKKPGLKKKFIGIMECIQRSYKAFKGEFEKSGSLDKESINQDLRFILPQAVETKIVVTMNVRELLHFFEERLCLRAQWEIRAVAGKMLKICRKTLPEIFKSAGPKCKRLGYCPEGDKGCGLYPPRH